eukprot:SAG31_NODE_1253_length_9089_cov_17.716765_7_plen_250_part_00
MHDWDASKHIQHEHEAFDLHARPVHARPNLRRLGDQSKILSYLILSYLILSYLILSYLILSYLILSYLICVVSVVKGGELKELIGLSWDCGAVTTGPVTVPLVLALGVGVANDDDDTTEDEEDTETDAERAKTPGEGDDAAEDPESDGSWAGAFGTVTLASVFPVIMVLLMGLTASCFFDKAELLEKMRKDAADTAGSSANMVRICGSLTTPGRMVTMCCLCLSLQPCNGRTVSRSLRNFRNKRPLKKR